LGMVQTATMKHESGAERKKIAENCTGKIDFIPHA